MTKKVVPDIALHVDSSTIERLFAEAPAITAFHMRGAVGDMVFAHRKALHARHEGTPMKTFVERSVKYDVQPRRSRRASVETGFKASASQVAAREAATRGLRLEQIIGRIRSWSPVAEIHEKGGTIHAKGRAMAIPLPGLREMGLRALVAKKHKAGRKAPLKFKAAKRRQTVRAGDVRNDGFEMFPSQDKRYLLAEVGGKVRALFRLMQSVRLKPRLGVMATWDAIAGQREAILERAVKRIVGDMAKRAATGKVVRGGVDIGAY